MSTRKQKIEEALDESRDYVNKVLNQVGDRWETQVYSDGLQWTVRQLVVHMADAERGHNYQIMNIAEGKDVIPEDFDVERYNAGMAKKTADKTAEQARQELDESRQALKTWLADLDDAKLDAEGRHASLRILPVEQILQWMPIHERGHADDIAEALQIEV